MKSVRTWCRPEYSTVQYATVQYVAVEYRMWAQQYILSDLLTIIPELIQLSVFLRLINSFSSYGISLPNSCCMYNIFNYSSVYDNTVYST